LDAKQGKNLLLNVEPHQALADWILQNKDKTVEKSRINVSGRSVEIEWTRNTGE
jgi:hypothetical protein